MPFHLPWCLRQSSGECPTWHRNPRHHPKNAGPLNTRAMVKIQDPENSPHAHLTAIFSQTPSPADLQTSTYINRAFPTHSLIFPNSKLLMKRPVRESPSRAPGKYIGVRRRKWGKWVSEIRVPTTRTRLWLGSYRTPEAAAIAHDTAVFCLHGPPSIKDLNFPSWVPATARTDMSPDSIQQVASAAGMDADARLAGCFVEQGHAAAATGERTWSTHHHHMAKEAGGNFAAESSVVGTREAVEALSTRERQLAT